MSMTLRAASSLFPGIPLFLRRREPVHVAKPAARAAPAPAQAKPATVPAKAPATAFSNIDFEKLLANTRSSAPVHLAPIEWPGEIPVPAAPAVENVAGADASPEARQRRLRDRYIGARFPGVARGAADLSPPSRVIKSARLYFEDCQAESALELLDLAIEQDSRAEALWLAQLEILFLLRETGRFVECARAFRAMHGRSDAWPEVARLGQALAPKETLFGERGQPRGHEHYGPWPDLPNWIQANWDLTAEVLASDFHRALERRAQDARRARQDR